MKAILTPNRRGLLGFFIACLLGVLCGLVAGIISREYGASVGTQYVVVAGFTIFGDHVVLWLLTVGVRSTGGKWEPWITVNQTGGSVFHKDDSINFDGPVDSPKLNTGDGEFCDESRDSFSTLDVKPKDKPDE